MQWILGNFRRDALWLLLPGVVAIALSFGYDWRVGAGGSIEQLLYVVLVLALIDNGHVYSTVWRTVFRPGELRTHWIYWVAPLFVFALFTVWIALSVPYLWAFVFYVAWYHHLRQYYGIARWYQKLNGRFCRWTTRFLYVLLVLPFILFHLRGEPGWYFRSAQEFFAVDWPLAFQIGLVVYGVVLAAWLIFEVRLWFTGVREVNRLLSVGAPAFVYAVCLLFGSSMLEVFFPMLVAHGVPYLAIIALSMRRVQPARYSNAWSVAVLLLITALLAGALVYTLENEWVEELVSTNATPVTGLLGAAGIALMLTPLFCHYIWDAFIWKGTHRDAARFYAKAEAIPH